MVNENSNQREFEIKLGAAKLNELIRDLVGDHKDDEPMSTTEIDVPHVKGNCIEKVVDF
jgi:hypothetical protein